jgi:hypothetical protein
LHSCAKDDINTSNFDDADIEGDHESSGAAGLKKRMRPAVPSCIKEAGPTLESSTPIAMGFSNAWQANNPTMPGGSYPTWQWMHLSKCSPHR